MTAKPSDEKTKQDKKVTAVKSIVIPGFVINIVSKLRQHTLSPVNKEVASFRYGKKQEF